MKLDEIRDILDDNYADREGETHAEHSQRIWDNAPRMPYKELPLSLQKEVRDRFTTDVLRRFLHDCYMPFSAFVKTVNPELGAKMESEEQYISFEEMTKDIPADMLDRLLIRTRCRAVYTIETDGIQTTIEGLPEYRLAPMLYGTAAVEAFEAVLDEYQQKQQQKQEKRSAAPAKAAAGIVSAGFYQSVISDKDYQFALSTQKNRNAYIARMNPEFFKQFKFENGEMIYNEEVAGIIKQNSQGKYEDIKELDLPLLWNFYTAAMNAQTRSDAHTITVSTAKFFREANIDTAAGNAQEIMKKLETFKNCVGILPGTKTIAHLFTVIEIDGKKGEMTFAVPYMFRLFAILEEKNSIQKQTKQGLLYEYERPHHNRLVHTSIASERNKTAVELVYIITNGLLQRGYVPDSKTRRKKDAKFASDERITYKTTFRSIINNAPMLRGRIASYEMPTDRNKALRRAFTKAYELLEKKTDMFKYFQNLRMNSGTVPTMQTLDSELIITHTGRNGDYKPHN